jgi:hypothetical protein
MTQRHHDVDLTVRIRRQWIFGIGKRVAAAFLPVSERFGIWLGLHAFNAMRVEYRVDGGRWRTIPAPYAVQEVTE